MSEKAAAKSQVKAGASKLRILIAKPGLDGHDRGAKVVARALSDAGYEVIYTGLHQTPEMIAATAVQEAVDAIGLSIMSGAHMTLFPAVMQELSKRDAGDVIIFGGGIIPEDDERELREQYLQQICNDLGAAPVQHIGKLLLIYRPSETRKNGIVLPKSKKQ